ncbi:hypothetical protein N2152v2_000649 [Parachlorella kessleri]
MQQVVRLAQEKAISLGHSSCEPAHLLLGVLKEAGARTAVEAAVQSKQKKQAFMGVSDSANAVLPLSTEAEEALNIAREVAQSSGEQCSAVHLLKGLLATQEVVALLNFHLNIYPEVVLAQCYSDALAGYAEASPTDGLVDTLEERATSKEGQELQEPGSEYWEDPANWSAPSDRLTPLHLAAQAGDVIAVRALLTAGGFDVNAKGPVNDTPLHFAIRGDHLDVLQVLLQAGADIDAFDFSGQTSLHSAAEHARDSCVRPLVAAGCNIEARDNYGMTPLGVAATNGHLGVIKALLECGADPDGGRVGGNAPLFLAVMYHQASAVQILLEAGADADSRGSDCTSALLYAAETGNVEIGRALLKAGADTEADSWETCMTPLHTAAAQGHKDFVKLLLAAGASMEATASDGGTPLHVAAQEGQVETIKELLAAGSDIHARDQSGRTPLEWAQIHSQLEAVDVLQSAAGKQDLSGSSLQRLQATESLDKEAGGPGLPAIRKSHSSSGRPDLYAMGVLQDGAQSGMWSGDTVRELAKMGANVPMVNYKFAHNGGGPSFLHMAAEQGNTDVIRALVECGVHPSLPTGNDLQVPAIHYACINNDHAQVIETLLELGASVDERDAAGYTTLAAAAQAGSLQCVKALLAHGADVAARDIHGLTVLIEACFYDSSKHTPNTKAAIVRLLLAAGADPAEQSEARSHIPNNGGVTALHAAAGYGNVGAIEALVEDGRADVDAAVESEGWRPLHMAVGYTGECHPGALLALLEAGADLNAASHDGTTALHMAARLGHNNAIDLLAAAGADLRAQDKNGDTALHAAVRNNCMQATAALVEAGAPLNVANCSGRTSLDVARLRGNGRLQVVKLAQEEAISLGHSSCDPAHLLLGVLKEAGPAASILIREGVMLAEARAAVETSSLNKREKQAFLDISDTGNPMLPLSTEAEKALDRAREVAEGAGERCSDVHMLGALLATQQAVALLEALGADPEDVLAQSFSDNLARDAKASIGGPNETLEERAFINGRQESRKQNRAFREDPTFSSAAGFEEFIRKSGYQRIRQPSNQSTPLHLAAEAGDAIAVRTLLTAGEYDVNPKAPGSDTPLHLAVRGGSVEVLQTLLAAGADVVAVDNLGDTSLHWAGIYGRDSFVRPLLAAGSNIEALNNFGMTPLGVAAECGHLGVIEALLKCGADADGGAEGGRTPLSVAAAHGQAIALQALLGAGADVNACGSDGNSALLCAAQSGNVECGEALLKAGADIQAATADTCATPLHLAAAHGHKDFVRLLLAAGANLEAIASGVGTPLHAAAQEGQMETINELLAAGSDIHARNHNGWTPTEFAQVYNQLEAVEVLQVAAGKQQGLTRTLQILQATASMDMEAAGSGMPGALESRSTSGRPDGEGSLVDLIAIRVLQKGAESGVWTGDTVRELAEMGVDVPMANFKSTLINGGLSFLHMAAEQGKTDVIRALVECGVDPSLTTFTELQVPAIHYACIKSDHAEVIETLLELGASVDERDTAGYTTLATAAEAGSLQCVKALLAHGADVSARHGDGWTVLMDACQFNSRTPQPHTKAAIVKLLLAAGADPTAQSNGQYRGVTALHVAAQLGHVGALEALLEDGRADVEAATEGKGWRPIHMAAGFGGKDCHPRALLALLEAGADVNSSSHDGSTALHIAALNDFINGIDLLVAAGADLGAQDNDGNTALHEAVIKKSMQAVAVLVEVGAPLNAVNAAGRTALGEARRMGSGTLVTFLQHHSS